MAKKTVSPFMVKSPAEFCRRWTEERNFRNYWSSKGWVCILGDILFRTNTNELKPLNKLKASDF